MCRQFSTPGELAKILVVKKRGWIHVSDLTVLGNFDAVLALATCPFRGNETKPLRKNFISHPAYWIDQNQGEPKADPAAGRKLTFLGLVDPEFLPTIE
jgi:hypothetical protein